MGCFSNMIIDEMPNDEQIQQESESSFNEYLYEIEYKAEQEHQEYLAVLEKGDLHECA